ncbi:MAG: hypothetical protein L0K86_16110 [Actinomycetia bacterium]|nr:hypothetical protein [Actinomycetes bacterium]
MPFDDDFDWQRGLIPQIKRVCANYLIGEAPVQEDMERNTDLIVLRLDPVRVACRLRRHDYLRRYPDEFTIRAGRPSGVQTELQKVLSGWGDYIFYGFASQDGTTLAAWLLGDLNVFRLWHHQQAYARVRPWTSQTNGDGSSTFHAYSVTSLPDRFVISRARAVKPTQEARSGS